MTTACDDLAPLLASAPLDLLLHPERVALEAHLAGCARCAEVLDQLRACLTLPAVTPAAGSWEKLAARIAAEQGVRGRVSLACTWCHDGLRRGEAVYCAACLAPHHAECFRTHGQCSAPGCDDTEVVVPRSGVASARRRWRDAALAGVAASLVLGVCGVAFAVVSRHGRQTLRAEFLATAQGALDEGKPSLEEAIAQRLALPAALLEDDLVEAASAKLDAALARARARAASRELLATLPRARDADERLAVCARAVEADPTSADALVARARAKYAVARTRAAESVPGALRASLTAAALLDLAEAIQQEPDAPLAYVVKGQLLLGRRSDAEARLQAESALRAAAGKDEGGPLGALAQGLLATVADQLDPAVAAYSRALALDPALVDAHLARAQVRLRRREFGKALEDASGALRLEPTSADARTLLAEARYFSTRASDRGGALRDLDAALERDPGSSHALAVRAYVRLDRDRTGDLVSTPEDRLASRRDAERSIAISGDEPLAHLALAEVTADTNPVEAKQHASRAIECGRHLLQTWQCRGRLRAREADEYAIQDFDEVLQLDPANALALTNKAAVLFAARRDAEQASVLLDRAIEADPELPWAFYWRGMIALAPPRNAQKYAQAVVDFSEAIARQPQFPDAYFRRACAYHDSGRYEDCLKDLAQAEAQRSQSGSSASQGMFQPHWVELMRGHCLFFTRQYVQAEAAYERYRAGAPPGDKALPGVLRRLEELRQLIAGQITSEQLSTDRSELTDDQPAPRRR